MRRTLVLLLATVLAMAGCSSESDADTSDVSTTTVTAETTTPTAPTTTAGAATGPLELVGTYDGKDCTYEGPETATISDEISLTLANNSADAVILKVILIPPECLPDIEPLVGSDTDYSGKTRLNPTIYAEAGPFEESSSLSFLPAPGTYVVECVLGGAIPTHSWWLTALEVTP